MANTTWIGLDARERAVLLAALVEMSTSRRENAAEIDALIAKLIDSQPGPDITIGVYGGQVQWVSGNLFPIRICDYDGAKEDLPDRDENGNSCRIWIEAATNASGA